jgi:glycosyltransferase involved in cell wall biosynthesis
MKDLIFIDLTTAHDHNSIKHNAIGASEYQAYNLLEQLSNDYRVTCYNHKDTSVKIDNILYKSFKNHLLNDNLETTIIIQRMLPNIHKDIYNKIKEHKILLWIHDLVDNDLFLFDYEKTANVSEIIREIYNNKNINFVFVSNFIREKFKSYFLSNGYSLEDSRLHTIYNIMYEEEYITVKNEDISVNKNYITYASAWQKGIEHVVNVFDYAYKMDRELKLVLLSPGYDWKNWSDYCSFLKNKYGTSIIIHGPVNKEMYSRIIKESLVVLSSTFQETFGCVFEESYYLGTPVIADCHSGAVKEIIDNNYIVDYSNKQSIYEKIKYIKENRDDIHVFLDDKFGLGPNILLWKMLI